MMALETKPWDSAEFLENEEDLADYLQVSIEDRKLPPIFGNAIAVAARARGGYDRLSLESGISETELLQASAIPHAGALPTLQKLRDVYARLARSRLVA